MQTNTDIDKLKAPLDVPMANDCNFEIGCNVVIGPSESGKTFLVQSVLEDHHLEYTDIMVMGSNPSSLAVWSAYFKLLERRAFIYEGFQEMIIKALVEICTRDDKCRPLIIYDDIMGKIDEGSKRVRNEGLFKWMFFNSRHQNMTSICLIQDITGVDRAQISNAKTIVMFNVCNYYTVKYHLVPKVLYSSLPQLGLSRASSSRQMALCTELIQTLCKHECLISVLEGGQRYLYRFMAKS